MRLGNFNYNIYDYDIYGFGKAEVSCASTSLSGSIDIPGGVSANGTQFNVLKVAENGFQACTSISSVSLPPTLISVEARGFYLCRSLQTVSFPYGADDPITFGKEAFSQCITLSEISLPKMTTSIGESIFSQCSSLRSITLPSSLKQIGKNAFSGCNNLMNVYTPSLKDWCNLEIANFEASPFSHNQSAALIIDGSKVTSLNPSSSITTIGSYCFAGNSTITKVELHEKFKSLGEGCFQYASNINDITSLSLTPPTVGNYCFDGVNKSIPIHVPDVAVEDYRKASGWSQFTNFVPIITESSDRFTVNGVVYSVTNMPAGECKVVSSGSIGLVVPSEVRFDNAIYSVTKIDDSAFENTDLDYIELPNTLREIGKRAFANTRLREITITRSVETIEKEAFKGCSLLHYVYFNTSKLTTIGEEAFARCQKLEGVSLPSSLKLLGKSAFSSCTRLELIDFNDGLTTICESAFMGTAITFLNIPKSVTVVEANAFKDCKMLGSVLIKTPEIFIGNGVFGGCNNLKEICCLSDNITNAEECNPFNTEGIKIYVNKPLFDILKSKNLWHSQEILERNIIIPEAEVNLAVDMTTGVTYKLQDASFVSNKLEWLSTDTNVFTYSTTNNGLTGNFITGKNVGSATLIVNGAYGLKTERRVNVLPRVEKIFLSNGKSEMNIGETDTISLEVLPLDAYINPTWSSSDEKVLSILENIDGGRKIIVRANDYGKSVITVNAGYGDLQESFHVIVTQVKVKSISLSPANWSGNVGESFKIEAIVLPENAVDKSIIWSSSDKTVATVDSNGNVVAVNVGETYIYATSADGSDIVGSSHVLVNPVNVESIALYPESWTGYEGETFSIIPTVLPENATNKVLSWTSSDETVATVDYNGRVTTLKVGETFITVKATDGSDVSATCKVTVLPTPVTSISIDKSEWSGKVGETIQLTATVLPEDATDKTIEWSSSDESVATVTNEGLVTAISVGEAVIIAKATDGSDFSATCKVTVLPTLVTSISLDKNEWIGKVEETIHLTATVLPDDATDKTIDWSSSDESVATVTNEGLVTALKAGNAIITAKATDGSGVSASCNITVPSVLVKSITVSPEDWSGEEGESFQLDVTLMPEDATDKKVIYISTDKSIAEVDQSGFVSVHNIGNCKIIVSTLDGSNLTAECFITSSAGIDEIFTEEDAKWNAYDLNGALLKKDCDKDGLKHLKSGIYILQNGQKITKIIIR